MGERGLIDNIYDNQLSFKATYRVKMSKQLMHFPANAGMPPAGVEPATSRLRI